MKNILITGINSYIGMSVEKWLIQNGDFKVETIDMKDSNWKEHDFSNYDTVFHVAGIAHADVGKVSEEVKKNYYKINTHLAIETAKKAKKAGVRQFIYMSSMIVYGGKEKITNTDIPQPNNFYGDSKWQADKGIRELDDKRFKVAILRPPMIYGKDSKGNYPLLAKLAKKLPVFPQIYNKRSMLYIENLCEFVRLIICNEDRGIFFPQNNELISTSDLVSMIADAHHKKIRFSKILGKLATMGKKFPGKIGRLCEKAFTSSYYDLLMSEYKEDYRIIDFPISIQRTEN